ncbi:MAG TPA: cytochrome c nitrite reductase small subunit [bacterium]|jgi:cytochrome c nitrite reductase small subunit
MKASTLLTVLPLAALGIVLGISAYTFYFARGYSYLSNNPDACVNCHVMKDKFDAWQVSPHRFALCNDCHVPHNLIGKYATKMEHGIRHSYVFTFGNPQVIRLKKSGEAIVEGNCIRCHETMVSKIFHGFKGDRRCFDCHRGMGHAF